MAEINSKNDLISGGWGGKKGRCLNTGRTHFKKGHIPWNKGLKAKDCPVIAKSLEKAHDAVRGKPAWNKGKLTPHDCVICDGLVKRKYMGYAKTCSSGCTSELRSKIAKRNGNIPPSQKGKKWGIDYPIENHHWWKGGISSTRERVYKSKDYQNWRTSIFIRDDYTCQICGKKGGRMCVDHYPETFSSIIQDNNIKSLEDAINCEALWDTDNGRTLCVECHRLTPTYGVNSRYSKEKAWQLSKN